MKIAVLVEENYEDLELWYPKIRLEEASFQVVVVGPTAGHTYKAKHGYPCKADISFSDAAATSFDAIVIPGGFAPDKLRRSPHVLHIVKETFTKGKPVAFICHGGWVPISAKILKGKKVTGAAAIKDDLENAGGIWQDAPVVVDGNVISSRSPLDLPFFAKAILEQLVKSA
jgi:protease I